MPPLTSHARFDLIISDIDGCLCPENPGPMDLASLAPIAEHNRLAETRRDRPILTLCSGRPQPFAECLCKVLHNTSVPCVAENGVWLYHPGTNRYTMDPAITPEQRAAVRDAAAWLEAEYGPKGVSQQPGKSASISLYHPDTAYLRTLPPRIVDQFSSRGWPLRVSMTWFYINCDLKHVSKGTGLDRLLQQVHIPKDRLAGIGDTPSDQVIRDRVGFFACPANADPEIKRVADYVSPFPEARGVEDILQRLA